MTGSGESPDLPRSRRWVRWVLGVPLGGVHLLNALLVYAVVSHGPQGEWDRQGYEGTAAGAFAAVFLSVVGIMITLVPPVRRALGPWWFAPPVTLGVIVLVRMATLG